MKGIWIAAAAIVVLLTVGVSGGILMASQSGDGDGSAAGNTQFVSRAVENIGLERGVVREAMDRAKLEMDRGTAGSRTFDALVAGNLGLETLEVESAFDRAQRDVLNERVAGRLASAMESGRIDRAERNEMADRLRAKLDSALEEGAVK